MRAILHIGRHKSGTSSLQHFMAGNRDFLAGQGIVYPRAGSRNGIAHHLLAAECNHNLSDGNGLPAMVEALRDQTSGFDTVLLSSEAFQNLTRLDRLEGVLAALGVTERRIFCYVREHVDYAVSAFRQYVHRQVDFVTFDDFTARLGAMDVFVTRWQQFGDLSIHWYDRKRLHKGDIVEDFLCRAGLPSSHATRLAMNPSIGGNLLFFKLAANHAGREFLHYNTLSRLAAEHREFKAPFRITDARATALRAASRYNATLAEHLGTPPEVRSWEAERALPDPDRLEDDLDRIAALETDADFAWIRTRLETAADWF